MPNLTEVYGGTTVLVNKDTLAGAPTVAVAWVNSLLNSVWPGHLLWIVVMLAVALGYIAKKAMNKGIFVWVMMSLVFFLALRAVGIGGA